MAVLKDVRCTRCGRESEQMVDADTSVFTDDCPKCDAMRLHKTVLRGGLKCITWGIEGIDVTDYVENLGVQAGIPRQEDIGTANEATNAKPVEDAAGGAIHERASFLADGLRERKERRKYARKRQSLGPSCS
jgi:hypothetical protein